LLLRLRVGTWVHLSLTLRRVPIMTTEIMTRIMGSRICLDISAFLLLRSPLQSQDMDVVSYPRLEEGREYFAWASREEDWGILDQIAGPEVSELES